MADVPSSVWCGGGGGAVRSERGRSGASLDESVKEEQSNTDSILSGSPHIVA